MSFESGGDGPAPLPARPAATVLLLRDTPAGISVFLMRRHTRMQFMAGAVVFPGGGVDPRDRHPDIAWSGPSPAWWAGRFGVSEEAARALVCAAARETFEESGVLFAGTPEGGIVADTAVFAAQRAALAANTLSFAEFLQTENLVLRADLLRPWAHWLTPEAERTRRYDTYFFVAALPDGQRADGENSETDLAGWCTAAAALADFAAGRVQLYPPTWVQLDAVRDRSVSEVLALEPTITAVLPRLPDSSPVGGDDEAVGEVDYADADRYLAARRSAQRAAADRRTGPVR